MVTLDQAGRGRPWLRTVLPPPDLRDLVEHFWIEDSRGINASHRGTWRIVPDGSAHLIFGTIEGSRTVRYRLSIVGARTLHTDIDRAGRVLTAGARLVPGALPALVGDHASTFTDFGAPLLDICPQVGREALERLADSTSEHALLRELVDVVRRTRRDKTHAQTGRIAKSIHLIDSAHGNVDIQRVAYEVGLAARTFRAVFAEQVGLSPKRYARIRRLHGAMQVAVTQREQSLAAIASKMGYADQAHMTRDFQALLGESPGAYLRRRAAI